MDKQAFFYYIISYNVVHIKGCDSNFEVNLFHLCHDWKLITGIIRVFKCYPSTYCSMQGFCFIWIDF